MSMKFIWKKLFQGGWEVIYLTAFTQCQRKACRAPHRISDLWPEYQTTVPYRMWGTVYQSDRKNKKYPEWIWRICKRLGRSEKRNTHPRRKQPVFLLDPASADCGFCPQISSDPDQPDWRNHCQSLPVCCDTGNWIWCWTAAFWMPPSTAAVNFRKSTWSLLFREHSRSIIGCAPISFL